MQALTFQYAINIAGGLAVDHSGNLFSYTGGGTYGYGTVEEFNTALQGSQSAPLHSFDPSTEGYGLEGALTVDAVGNLYGVLETGGPYHGGGVFELSGTNHQTFTMLVEFNGANGVDPEGGLTIDANGNIWGTTGNEGLYGNGTVYELSGPNHQTLTTIFNYNGTADGTYLEGGLTPDAYGNLYGEGVGISTGDIFELTNTGFAVPEPTGVSLLAVASLAFLRRRRLYVPHFGTIS